MKTEPHPLSGEAGVGHTDMRLEVLILPVTDVDHPKILRTVGLAVRC